MTDQLIILIFLILAVVSTLGLYFWKAKKEMEYKKDERWQLIQIKANLTANISNWILIILLAIGSIIMLYMDTEITFTLQRVILFGETRNLPSGNRFQNRNGFRIRRRPSGTRSCHTILTTAAPI